MSLTDQNMLQMSQVLQSAQKCTRPPTRESRGGNGVLNASGEAAAPFATLDKTVSAFVGDVPGGSLERLGKPSRILTVICNASMSEPRHPLCRRYHTRLVGLRRSLASFRSGNAPWVGCSIGGGWNFSSTCRNLANFKSYNECTTGVAKAAGTSLESWWYCSSLGFKN